jgi:rhamnose transport system ATP-binding protein
VTPGTATPFLSVDRVSKRFYTVQALHDVSLDLCPGEVHAVVGENGAGKTTLMRILGGEERPDHGRIILDGHEVRFHTPLDAQRYGVAVVHQHFELVPAMTVAENITLRNLPARLRAGPFSILDRRRLRTATRDLLDRFQIDLDPDAPVSSLGVAEQQLLEIAKALAQQSRVLILDEPTSSLGPTQIDRLFGHIRSVVRHGTAVIFISHKVDEMLVIADRVTVLRDGKRVCTERAADLDAAAVVRLIIGRELADMFQRGGSKVGEPVARAEALRPAGGGEAVSFGVRRGEILGVTGLLGSGVSRLFKLICGEERGAGGTLEVMGRRLSGGSIKEAIRAGVCLVPGDRHTEGLVLDRSVEENILLPNLNRVSRWGLLNAAECRELCRSLIRLLDIRPGDPTMPVKFLSGGNQQKVVIAKWLASRALLLVMDHPTKGVDVGAKAEIHRVMGRFVADGRAIVFGSSELPEVVGMSDRLLVMHRGRITGRFQAGQMDPERVMACATGTVAYASRADPWT